VHPFGPNGPWHYFTQVLTWHVFSHARDGPNGCPSPHLKLFRSSPALKLPGKSGFLSLIGIGEVAASRVERKNILLPQELMSKKANGHASFSPNVSFFKQTLNHETLICRNYIAQKTRIMPVDGGFALG